MTSKPDLHKMKKLESLKIQPYERYLPTAFDESLSILEKMNKVIWQLKELGELTEEMLEKWNDVIDWVMEDGLEQAVIDQLEEWLDDGTIKDIINKEIFQELRDDLDDLQDEVDKKLDKKLDLNGYYDEHSLSYYRDDKSETSYMLMKIPKYDDNGDIISIKVTDDKDTTGKKKITEFSEMKQATAMINASPTSGSNDDKTKTTIMNNKDVRRRDSDMRGYNYIIAWDKDNKMKSFSPNTAASDMKDQGYITAIPAFLPLIEDGKDITDSTPMSELDNTTDPHPRVALAQDSSGNTYFFVTNGRLIGEYGMKTKDVVRVLRSHGMQWAHMLDGGGSTTLVDYQQVMNRMPGADSGDRGATERDAVNAIYIGKDKVNKTATKLLKHVGDGVKSVHRHNQYLEALRYQKNNYIPLGDFCKNGWKTWTDSGDNTLRAWILPNNTLYMRGVLTGGKDATTDNTKFMQLPKEIPPMFNTHHLVAGDNRGEIYKIVIRQDGELEWYFWNEDFTSHDTEDSDWEYYIRLDGIFIPLNYTSNDDDLTRTQGIQSQWIPHGVDD